jgi:hypothetical protein
MTDDNSVNISGGNVEGFIQENNGIVTQYFISQVSESISGGAPSAEQPLTQIEFRQRTVLLSKVKEYWIKGVLEKSLHTQAMIKLGLENRADAVEPPFRGFQELPEESKQILPTGTEATQVFNQMGAGRTLLILGEPGAGKTITLLKLAQNLIERAEANVSCPIPVVFNLSSWGSKQQTVADWLKQELWSKYQVSKEVGKGWVNNQQLILLLDGLDEVKAEHQKNCVQAINQFMQEYGQTEIVICSRIEEYKVLSNRLQLRGAIYIHSLTLDQVNQYLDAAREQLEAVKTLLQEDIVLQDIAKSPLMLNVITLAYGGKKVEELPQTGSVKKRREHLFNTYIERMFLQEKIGKPREYKFPYQNHQAKSWLTWLAQNMSQSVFQIEEIQPSCLSSKKEKIYRITIGLILGLLLGLVSGVYYVYFYTVNRQDKLIPEVNISIKLIAIGVLSGLIPGLITALLSSSFNRLIKGLISGIIFAISIFLFSSFTYHQQIDIAPIFLSAIFGGTIFSSIDANIKPVENIELDLNRLFKYAIFFGILGIFYTLTILYLENFNPKNGYQYCIYEIIVFIIVGVISGGFRIQKNRIDPKQATPNQGIKRSLRYTVITFWCLIFTTIFTTWGMDFSFHFNPALICIGLVVGLLGGLGANESSGVVCIQHLTLRLILHRDNYIPWNYARFLDYASKRIFLQKVGGGYIFVHRELMEHFAKMK